MILVLVGLAIYNHEADNGIFHMGLKDPNATIQQAQFICNSQWRNDDCINTILTQEDQLKIVINAIKHAKPIEGILDQAEEYNIVLHYNDQTTHHYSLSLGFEHNARTEGLIVDGSNSHQGYRISKADTNQLRDSILQSTTFPQGLPEPKIQSKEQSIAVYPRSYCVSTWNDQSHLLEYSCGIAQAPEINNQQIKSRAISLDPLSQIKVDFPTKPAKIELYMVKNGEHLPVALDNSGRYTLPLERGYKQYILSSTWNKDNHSDYYFGVHIR